MNYHERMLNLRQASENQSEEQQENPPIIQKIARSQETNKESKQKLSTPSNISTNDHSDANASQSK